MPVALVVFTRDLRVHDHPALVAAARADAIVPAFVFDDAIVASRFATPNRVGALLGALDDLDASLRDRGAPLVTRRGTWVHEVLGLASATGADAVHVSDDVSGYARRRLDELERAADGAGIAVQRHPGVTAVPPGALVPSTGGDHFRVFTPYHRRWLEAPHPRPHAAPRALVPVPHLATGRRPALADLVAGSRSPDVIEVSESAARDRLTAWTRRDLARYDERHDDLPGDATSHLGAALHLGCISPAEVVARTDGKPGGDAYARQLCWRDFFHQVLAARPDAAWRDYRSTGVRWEDDDEAFGAWCEGRTGYPVVDAAMRQLLREGFVHNRARMVAASFLVKDLGIRWQRGARHFLDHLVDGDVANNNLNWQWVAGTGTDTNPSRVFNPVRQGERFDPDGDYVRRYVPELADVGGGAVHALGPLERAAAGYPEPIVDHRDATAAHRARWSR